MRQAIAGIGRTGLTLSDVAVSRPFVCRYCLVRAASKGFPVHQRRGYAEKKRLTERLRRKIWGTDEPPGQKDPYGEPKIFRNKPEPKEETVTNKANEFIPEEAEAEQRTAYESTTVEKAMADDPSYVPAETWDGLDRIGGPTGWWEEAWDAENPFVGFMRDRKFRQSVAWKHIHRAYVEVNVLQQAGLDINDVTKMPTESEIGFWLVDVREGDGNEVTLKFPDEAWRQQIIDSIGREKADVAATTEEEAAAFAEDLAEPLPGSEAKAIQDSGAEVAPEVAEGAEAQGKPITPPTDASVGALTPWKQQPHWQKLSTGNLPMKFALVKRVMQLTGERIADPVIARIDTLGKFEKEMTKKEPPKKLAEALLNQPDLIALPNVHIAPQRQTYVDKEKKVGRWKVIVDELEERNLPVPGQSMSLKS